MAYFVVVARFIQQFRMSQNIFCFPSEEFGLSMPPPQMQYHQYEVIRYSVTSLDRCLAYGHGQRVHAFSAYANCHSYSDGTLLRLDI